MVGLFAPHTDAKLSLVVSRHEWLSQRGIILTQGKRRSANADADSVIRNVLALCTKKPLYPPWEFLIYGRISAEFCHGITVVCVPSPAWRAWFNPPSFSRRACDARRLQSRMHSALDSAWHWSSLPECCLKPGALLHPMKVEDRLRDNHRGSASRRSSSKGTRGLHRMSQNDGIEDPILPISFSPLSTHIRWHHAKVQLTRTYRAFARFQCPCCDTLHPRGPGKPLWYYNYSHLDRRQPRFDLHWCGRL